MIPAGFMAKRVVAMREWLPQVSSIYSVSGCISTDFADYIQFWGHDGYWLFDSPEVIVDLARRNTIDLAGNDAVLLRGIRAAVRCRRLDPVCAGRVVRHQRATADQ
jgi:hypothetical protein